MASLRDFNLPRPSYIHLFPVITSTVAVVFSFIECMLLRSILSPSIPTAYAPTIWGSYITIGNNYIRFARRFLSGGGASAVSGLLCFESLQRTKGPAKALYTCGLAFSLLNFFVFLPHAIEISRKIINGPRDKAKDEVGALLDVQTSRRRLADFPAMVCFTLGFAKLCRLR